MANKGLPIIPIQWEPRNGGIKSDIDPKVIQNGDLYCTIPETGGLNIRAIGKGTNVSPSYEPMVSDIGAFNIAQPTQQVKQFRLNIDITDWSAGAATITWDVDTPSRITLGSVANAEAAPVAIGVLMTNIEAQIALLASLTPTTAQTTVSANEGYIDFYFDDPPYLDFAISNLQTTNEGIGLDLEVTQEAWDAGMVGEWNLIGSDDRTGDQWEAWTTRRGPEVTISIQNVINNGAGLYRVTTSQDHGLVTNQSVKITGVDGNTNINGIWTVSVITATQFDILGSTFGGLYVASTGTMTSNIAGLGEIGVAERDDNGATVSYVRLLRSREFNWTTYNQVDMRVKHKQDGSTAMYFVDGKFNIPRVLYYKGDFVADGALTSVNAENIYSYGDIANQLRWLLGTAGGQLTIQDQLDQGGSLYSGNWRYTGRFLTQNLSGSDYLLSTPPIPVFSESYDANPRLVIGDDENTVTSKINQIQINNPDTELYKYFELIAINYVGLTPRAYYVGRYDLSNDEITVIQHTGNENSIEDFDLGLINTQLGGFYSAANIELQDNRALLSNLIPITVIDFSDFVETIRYSIERDSLPTVGIYATGTPSFMASGYQYLTTEGEFTNPLDAATRKGFMYHETYRCGFIFKYKDTDTWSNTYFYDDITIDLPAVLPPNRDAGSFTSFDLTDTTRQETYSVYLDFHGFDLDFPINGVPFRDIVSEIQPVFVKRTNPSVYSGCTVLGVYGRLSDSNARAAYYDADLSNPTDYYGPYPWVAGTTLAGTSTPPYQTAGTFTSIVANDDDPYPGLFTAYRPFTFTFIPDDLYSQIDISPNVNDEIISIGRGQRYTPWHDFPVSGPGGTGWPPNYAEFNGYTNVTTNAGRDIVTVTAAEQAGRGAAIVGSSAPLNVVSLKFLWDGGAALASAPFTGGISNQRAVEKCIVAETTPSILNAGVGPDYGCYITWYRKPLADQYGDIRTSVYEHWGPSYVIGDDTGIVATGTCTSQGDVFTQKSYMVFMYPAGDGYQMTSAIGFFSQNTMNTQMKRRPTPNSTLPVPPVDAATKWLGQTRPYINNYPQNPDAQLNYNKGYTPQGDGRLWRAFDTDAIYQVDWSNAITWSEVEIEGANTDGLRYFPPLNIKFLDYTDGPIVQALNLNNEYVTFQHKRVMRQYFNTANVLTTAQGAEVVIGDGSVMGRKGQTMTQFGCRNKWSVVVGKSEKGHDVVYYIDSLNKNLCRIGYDGTNDIAQINGMKSFFANYLRFVIGKDRPADGEGICGVANQRYRDVFMTFRGIRSGVQVWDNAVNYTTGQVVQYTPAVFTNFHQTGEFYRALRNNVGLQPDANPDDWEVVAHTDGEYYNEYTIVWNEQKNEFQGFWSGKPKIYARFNDSVLIPRPVSDTGRMYEMNDGDSWTTWFDDGVTSLQGPSFFDAVINAPEGRKGYVAIRHECDNRPDRVEVRTNQHYTFMDSADFEQREGGEFDVPVHNDATATGIATGDTSKLYGDWAIVRSIMNAGNYNKWTHFFMKVKARAREFMR